MEGKAGQEKAQWWSPSLYKHPLSKRILVTMSASKRTLSLLVCDDI